MPKPSCSRATERCRFEIHCERKASWCYRYCLVTRGGDKQKKLCQKSALPAFDFKIKWSHLVRSQFHRHALPHATSRFMNERKEIIYSRYRQRFEEIMAWSSDIRIQRCRAASTSSVLIYYFLLPVFPEKIHSYWKGMR